VKKSAYSVELCKQRGKHWEKWEAGIGLGQRKHDNDGVPAVKNGLGDQVEKMLKSLGITQERYVQVKQLFGLPPTCGCAKRREWLNKVGQWLNGE
jgi:hypothetical protein